MREHWGGALHPYHALYHLSLLGRDRQTSFEAEKLCHRTSREVLYPINRPPREFVDVQLSDYYFQYEPEGLLRERSAIAL